MNGLLEQKIITDMETGEVLSATEKYILSKEYDDNAINWAEVKRNKDEFTMIMDNEFGKYYFYFYKKLELLEIPTQFKLRFLFLCSYANWDVDGNMLVDTDKQTHQYKLTRVDLIDRLKLGSTELKKTISILKQHNLIDEVCDTYYINSDYVIRGGIPIDKAKERYTRIFSESMKELYINCQPRLHKQLYYLFALLPYVNHKFNVVCANPEAQEEYLIQALNMKDICSIVDYNPKNITRLWSELKLLKIKEKYVIKKVDGGDGEFIKINPKIYYAGTSSQLNALKGLMADFEYRVH